MSSDEEDAEIVQAFLDESRENLDQLDRDLVELESHPGDAKLLSRVYRAIHTIKGTCGFLGYHRLEALNHAGENLLDALRSGTVDLDAAVTSVLLALVDAVRVVLAEIADSGGEGEDLHVGLIGMLVAAAGGGDAPDGGTPTAVPDAPGRLLVDLSPARSSPEPATTAGRNGEAAGPVSTSVGRDAGAGSAPVETSVRVDVAVLDRLMELVGELVLTRNRIGALAPDHEGPLAVPYGQLRLVTAELQESVMQARLQATGTVTSKFHRIARDLAASLGKRVRVEVEGEDVGVDKAVNEALRDPLLHLVRNAIDHGLEGPDERIAAGKDPEGRLEIRTFHERGLVHLEVVDDGRGIDPDRLKASAVRAGLITADAAAALEPAGALELMFRAGLSTADRVTTVSGRGVGLDVVRAQLDQIGGTIEVTSQTGRGTRFRINVPLTLAIMSAVLVRSNGQWYSVPQVHVQEVVHLGAGAAEGAVDDIHGARILRRRDRLIPLVDLATQLATPTTDARAATDDLDVLIVEIDGRHFGIEVDAVGESIEAVVKPLTRATRSIPVLAGVTILGDGRPSLILDLGGLAAAAGLPLAGRHDPHRREAEEPERDDGGERLLLATTTGGARLALPLVSVVRLEHFDGEQVQPLGTGEVIQYAGAALPLLRLADLASPPSQHRATPSQRSASTIRRERPDALQAIVCQSSAGHVGIVVDRIEDVVQAPAAPSLSVAQLPRRRGVVGTLIINERITELLDIEALVAEAGICAGGPR